MSLATILIWAWGEQEKMLLFSMEIDFRGEEMQQLEQTPWP